MNTDLTTQCRQAALREVLHRVAWLSRHTRLRSLGPLGPWAAFLISVRWMVRRYALLSAHEAWRHSP